MTRRIRRLLQKSRSEAELDQELRFHVDRQIADYVAAGLSPEEARRRARLEFGGLDRVKEEVRDTLTWTISSAISATPSAIFAETAASPLSLSLLSPSVLALRPSSSAWFITYCLQHFLIMISNSLQFLRFTI